jgi:branched-chain amino acid transport system permease protein
VEQLIAIVTQWIVLSAIYILVALGFVFLLNMLGIFNFAHGAVYMISAYICYYLVVDAGLNRWLALVLTTIIIAAFGIFLERFCFRPFGSNFNRTIMVCIGISTILVTSMNIEAGTQTIATPPFVDGIFRAGLLAISYEKIVIMILGIVLLGVFIWFLNRTRMGQQLQAIAQNKVGAALHGINIKRSSALACALGCGLAAVAGSLMGSYLFLSPFMGDSILTKVMIIVMLAGIGSVSGVFIGGLALGALDAVLPIYISGAASSAIVVAFVIVVLLIRPQGFFGHEVSI